MTKRAKDPLFLDPKSTGFMVCLNEPLDVGGYPHDHAFFISIGVIPKENNPLYYAVANDPTLLHEKPMLYKERNEKKFVIIKGMKDYRQTKTEIHMTITYALFNDNFEFVKAADKYERDRYLLGM